MMVLYELNINLNEIASGGNLKETVHKLIEHCQGYNQLEELIHGALENNPNNVHLNAIQEKFKITTSLVNILGPLEKTVIKQMQQAYRDCCPNLRDKIPGTFYDILKKLDDIHQPTDDEKRIVKFVDRLLVNGKIPTSEAQQLKQWLENNANNVSNLLSHQQNFNSQPDLIVKPNSREESLKRVKPEGLKQFSFEVVTVNRRGRIIKRESQQAGYFTQDLGNGVDLDMVYIPPGSFLMGSPESEKGSYHSERPQHQVSIQPFFLGKYPVTQAQWRAVANLPKIKRDLKPDPSRFKGKNRPVERVNWYDAVEFCDRLCEYTATEYRLPTEAEWEYACRAGTTTPFHYGETITSRFANYNASNTYAEEAQGEYRGKTTDVGSFPPNGFGLYDMHGNVWEWCADPWHGNYEGAPRDGSIWSQFDNNTDYYTLRGGSCLVPRDCRSASRLICSARDLIYYIVGFRVARGVGRT
ncbi:MAG: formylglycine-generating enzyme family protein [Moorea sp. SIO4A1]|nr:formylglycine-generating enzyme family protein [Moorena sp. SIO4A5]NEQ60071.1 formylglycine-generating enzyme family protein [Moorena sp. SIO4A1]